jgi:hypothetical protein
MRQWIRMLIMALLLVVGIVPVAFARGSPGGFHGGFHGGSFGHGGFHGSFHGWHGGHWGHFHHPHFHGGIIVEAPPLWIAPEPSYVAPACDPQLFRSPYRTRLSAQTANTDFVEAALDDRAPRRDNSQGPQPSASRGYLGDDPMYSMAPQPPVVCILTLHVYV